MYTTVHAYLILDVLCPVGIHESVECLHEVPVTRTDASYHQCSAVCVWWWGGGGGGGGEVKTWSIRIFIE